MRSLFAKGNKSTPTMNTYSSIAQRGTLEERFLTFQDTIGKIRRQRRLMPRELGAMVHARFVRDDKRDFIRRTRKLTGLPRDAIFRCIKGLEGEQLDQLNVIRKATAQGYFGDRRFDDAIPLMEIRALFPKICPTKASEILTIVRHSVLLAIEEFEILGWITTASATQAMLRYTLSLPRKTAGRYCALGADRFKTACFEALRHKAITPHQYARAVFCFATYLSPDVARCLDLAGHMPGDSLAPVIERAAALSFIGEQMRDVAIVRDALQVPRCVAWAALGLVGQGGTPEEAVREYHVRQLVVEAEVSREEAEGAYAAAGEDYDRAVCRLLWPGRRSVSMSSSIDSLS